MIVVLAYLLVTITASSKIDPEDTEKYTKKGPPRVTDS
jgi:hypothetical protein